MPKDPRNFREGYGKLTGYLNDLYTDLDDLTSGLGEKPEYKGIGKANEDYKSSLRKGAKSLGKSIDNMNKLLASAGKISEKEKKKFEEIYVEAMQNVLNSSAGLYASLDPDINDFLKVYTQAGFNRNKFKNGAKILEKYYLDPVYIAEIKKNIKTQKEKADKEEAKKKKRVK